MGKRSFSRLKREKLVIYLTSGLVVGACGLTAFWVNRNQNTTEDGYVIDLAELDRYQEETKAQAQPGVKEEAGVVNSDSVVNRTAKIPAETQVAEEAAAKPETEVKKAADTAVTQKTAKRDLGHIDAMEIAAAKKNEPAVTADSDSVTNKTEETTDPAQDLASLPAEAAQTAESAGAEGQQVLQFDATQKMMWPLSGEVLIDYSMDRTVYFPTLDQYKYNPGIYIGGEGGASVCAAAKGTVKTIDANEEIGQYLIMELGDGYEATYGQLQDITVKEGDLVAKGQIIAGLAAPTKYHSLEGANLYFALRKDGESINPAEYLE